ncbi:MAG: hypothetical protein ACXW2E_01810 [Nitrososphaeraceae archaeon]
MLNSRNKSVNVSRVELLKVLIKNLEVHREQYKEAVDDFTTKLKLELTEALITVNDVHFNMESVKKIKIGLQPPVNHENEYIEVIEMLEMSIDDSINLDAESFKAYIKNQWSWTNYFWSNMLEAKAYISDHNG